MTKFLIMIIVALIVFVIGMANTWQILFQFDNGYPEITFACAIALAVMAYQSYSAKVIFFIYLFCIALMMLYLAFLLSKVPM